MPSYLWSGKDGSGNEVTERVTAATPEAARNILLERGWTDLRLRTSEIHEFVQKGIEAASNPDYVPNLTPQEEVAFLEGTAAGFWANWWKATRESAVTNLLLVLWFAWSVYRQKLWSIVLSGGFLVGLLFLFPVLHFWFGKPGELFEKLHVARNWWRWKEVLAILEELKKAQKSRRVGIGDAEMARYRALALAGLGRVDEAIDYFTEEAKSSDMPRWIFYSHLASIYTVAQQHEKALESYRQSLEVSTEKGVTRIDYAICLVQRFNRPAEARQLLAIAESSPVPDMAEGHLCTLRSLIALREGDFQTAERWMGQALNTYEKMAKGRRFIFEPGILLSQGYLAYINAELGRKDAARGFFAKSERYLATIHLNELIRGYRAKMGSDC